MKLLTDAKEFAEKLIERLEYAFKTHPKVDTFHVTEDGQLFAEKNHATFHAQKLSKKDVASVNRTDLAVLKSSASGEAAEPASETGPSETEANETKKNEVAE